MAHGSCEAEQALFDFPAPTLFTGGFSFFFFSGNVSPLLIVVVIFHLILFFLLMCIYLYINTFYFISFFSFF